MEEKTFNIFKKGKLIHMFVFMFYLRVCIMYHHCMCIVLNLKKKLINKFKDEISL